MSIRAQCGACGKTYQVDDRFAGRKAACKACGEAMLVPGTRVPSAKSAAPARAVQTSAQKQPAKPARKQEAADGEFDFSGLDEIENSGTIDHSYTPPPVALTREPQDRSKGTPAPAHLLASGGARAGSAQASEGAKRNVQSLIILGVVVVALIGGVYYMMTRDSGSKPAVAAKPAAPADDDDPGALDGTASGMRKFADHQAKLAAKRHQEQMDAVPLQDVPPLPFPARTTFPELGDVQPGPIDRYTWTLNDGNLGEPMGIMLYLPAGAHAPQSLPCIMLSAAMSDPLEGQTSTDRDIQEAAGFVENGFAVMIYDTSRFSFANRPQSETSCVTEFMQSEGGMHFARNAINLLAARAVMVDMNRLYAVGQGGSGTMALNLAANDKRIRAVATLSPMCDVAKHVGQPIADVEGRLKLKGIGDFAAHNSPINRVKDLKCPVLVLNEPGFGTAIGDDTAFVAAMRTAGNPVVADSIKPEEGKVFAREVLAPQIAKWLKSLTPGR
jgi:dienelactone hydrolase